MPLHFDFYKGVMFLLAIIETGGKQYKISENAILKVEKINGNEGEEIIFDKVLLIVKDNEHIVGKPYVEGAKVRATLLKNYRDRKVKVVKYRPRKNYRRNKSHRQWYSLVKIEEILV